MNPTISALAPQRPHVQPLVNRIDELLELRAISHHEYLEIVIPKGILHWPVVPEIYEHKCITIKIGVMGTALEVVISIRDTSDTACMLVKTLLFDSENGESAYAISGVVLSPKDFRAFIAYLLSAFWPSSISITESE